MFLLGTSACGREILMTRETYELRLYTVVEVWRGVAAGAKNFMRLRSAQKYMRRLRRGRNLAEDDVQLFEANPRLAAKKLSARLTPL